MTDSTPLDRNRPVPMYHQLRLHLQARIDGGELAPGTILPGEHRLCEIYGVSRTVVRHALAQMEHEGLIQRVKGKGTFVSAPKTPEVLVHTLSGLFHEMAEQGKAVRSEVLFHDTWPATAAIAAALEVSPGENVVLLERMRYVQGEPWSWSTTYMPYDVGRLTLGADLRNSSLYELLEGHGIRPVRGSRSVEAASASAQAAQLLGVAEGRALLVLRSTAYDDTQRPFEHFVAYHRGDRSKFEFEITAT